MNSIEPQINLPIPLDEVARVCERNSVRRMLLFGSVVRQDFRSSSDVDILVEFDCGATPGLGFFRLQRELTGLLGRNVDLNTLAMLHESFRAQVAQSAVVIYAN